MFGAEGQTLEQRDSFGLRLLSPSFKKVGPASLTKAWQPIMIDPGDGGGGDPEPEPEEPAWMIVNKMPNLQGN